MAVVNWTCPYCDRDTTINLDHSTRRGTTLLDIGTADGYREAEVTFVVCPNPRCLKFTFEVWMFKAEVRRFAGSRGEYEKVARSEGPQLRWHRRLEPPSSAKVFPAYVPVAIRDDYTEACAIVADSPKASATLARRCLQGMIRDYWGIKKPEGHKGLWTLNNEINALKDRVDPDVWDAMDGLRRVGNIGAHMEQDVNVMVDVEPDEASLLIRLIETLVKEWYVNREQRKEALKSVATLAASKEAAKKEGAAKTADAAPAVRSASAGAPTEKASE